MADGSPLTDQAELSSLRAPVCGIFGCDDLQIPQPTVDAFRAALEAADVEHEVISHLVPPAPAPAKHNMT